MISFSCVDRVHLTGYRLQPESEESKRLDHDESETSRVSFSE